MSYNLPKSWGRVRLEELTCDPTAITYGVLKPGPFYKDGVPMLRVMDLVNSRVDETKLYKISKELAYQYNRTTLRGGEVLISVQGSVGRVAIVSDCLLGANISRTLAVIPLIEPSHAKWIWTVLQTPQVQSQMNEVTGGTTRDSLNLRDLRTLEVPFPPLSEQQRIVAKLEVLLDKVDACQKRLERIPALLKRFRQAVLSAACSGRLTADWRNENPNIDAAQVQLEAAISSVATEYDKACQAAKSDHLRKPSRPTCLDDYESAWIDDTDIPDTWFVTPLGKVCSKVTDGTHDTPKPSQNGVPYITAKHIRERRIDFENSLYLPIEEHEKIFARCNPQWGDVLIVNIGAGSATPAMVKVDFEFSLKNVALLKPIKGLLLGKYLEFYQLHSKPRVFDEITRGGAQPFMGLDIIKKIPFYLPPLDEQHEIVHRVEALFTFADRIEERYTKAKAHIDKLIQSILAKAFCGELVPQDPNDEPASILLDRIRQDKARKIEKDTIKNMRKRRTRST